MGLEVKQEGGGIERERIDDQRCECNNSCYLGGRVLSYGGHQKNLRGGNKKKTKRIDPISLYVSNSSSSNYICTTITIHTHTYTHSPRQSFCFNQPPFPVRVAPECRRRRRYWRVIYELVSLTCAYFFRVHVLRLLLSSFILLLHVPSQFDKKRKKKR